MKSPFRLIIAIVCSGVLLFAAFILAVNLYVQSAGMQSRIRTELSDAIGVPVTFFRTTFSPWGGFRLDQIKIASPSSLSGNDFMRADCLEVRCQLVALLNGRTVLKRIVLHSPVFVFQENDRHQFGLPRVEKIEMPLLPSKIKTAKVDTLPEAVRPPVIPSPNPVVRSSPVRPDFDIQKLLLRNGSFRFMSRDGKELFRLEDVRCFLESAGPLHSFTGKLQIERAVILNFWEINRLKSPITLQGAKLHVQKLEGDLGGGHLEGALEGDFSHSDIPYNLRLELNKAQLAAMLPPDSAFGEEVDGMVNARLELAGVSGKTMSNQGHAEWKVSNAKVSLFQTIGALFNMNMGDLRIPKAEAKAEIINSEIRLQPSIISSGHLQIGLSGRITSQQKLDLQGQLILDAFLFKKLPSETRDNFVENPEDGHQVLDFAVNGSLSAPQTNLQDRLIGDRLPKAIRGFLGGKNAAAVPTPKATPQVTPKASPQATPKAKPKP